MGNRIRRALISVSDKSGLVDFARGLSTMGVEILSTGGTAKALRDAGISVKDVSEHTGFPEMMDGRLKTLHPKIHGGLLGRRDNPGDVAEMEKHGIDPIDMVVVNLYPFEATISKKGVTFSEAIENIDIGGPTMLRASAKNFRDVAVVVDPRDYDAIFDELRSLDCKLSYKTLYRLATKVFEHTSRYDTLIAEYLASSGEDERAFPESLTLTYRMAHKLRYGENPHQEAVAYVDQQAPISLLRGNLHQGRTMSFNNYLDAHSGLMMVREFGGPCCAIIKHESPCGVGLGGRTAEAFHNAFKADPISIYGATVVFNSEVDEETAQGLAKRHLEVIVAPAFSPGSLAILAAKPQTRVIELHDMRAPLKNWDVRRVAGGLLAQEWDVGAVEVRALKPVTVRQPTEAELDAMDLAWKVCKHASTCAVVYAFGDYTAGIGIGQTSRVYAARVGAINSPGALSGSVVASDGFIAFPDAVLGIKKAGATAIIQPGGSARDREMIALADEMEMAMLFTGIRHFKH